LKLLRLLEEVSSHGHLNKHCYLNITVPGICADYTTTISSLEKLILQLIFML
jgi:hypothetical protein